MRPLLSRSLALSLALPFVLAACSGDAPPPAPPQPEVTVVTLQSRPVTLERELAGRTSAFLIAEVRQTVNGIVKRRLLEEGRVVKAGQPLYKHDDASYSTEPGTAPATLARARAPAEN